MGDDSPSNDTNAELSVQTTLDSPSRDEPRKPQRRRMGWKRWLIFLSVPYILIILILVGIEIYVRATKPYVPSLQVFVEVVLPGLFEDKQRNHVYRGDPWLSWGFRENLENVWWEYTTFSTNDEGIRYPGSIGKKSKGSTRILCMGDSVTFGYRVPQTSPETPLDFEEGSVPYAIHMEQLLNEGLEQKAYQAIPLAIPGYSSHHGKIWLRRDIGKYDPDIVTILFGFNDIYPMPVEDKDSVPTGKFMIFQRWLMMRSQAMIYISRWIEAKRQSSQESSEPPPAKSGILKPRVSEKDYVANIMEMTRIAQDHGAKVVIISPVYRDRLHHPDVSIQFMEYARSLRSAAVAANVPYLELNDVDMTAWPRNGPLFSEVIHPLYPGHVLMANELIYFMRSEKILP